MISDLRDPSFAGRFRELERRLSAIERRPQSAAQPLNFVPAKDLDSTRRAVLVIESAWVDAWTADITNVVPAVYVVAHVAVPTNTVADLRLLATTTDGQVASTQVWSNLGDIDFFRTIAWEHGLRLRGDTLTRIAIQVRRTSGSGAVQVFVPASAVGYPAEQAAVLDAVFSPQG